MGSKQNWGAYSIMNEKKIIGFDFGTTNSLISVIRAGRPINYLEGGGLPIPSVVCYEGARTIVGRKAKENLAQAGLGIQGNVIRSPKMFLGKDSIFVEGVERNTVEVVADVIRHVHDRAQLREEPKLGEVVGAVVTIPVDMEGYQRRALREAFNRSGLRIIQYVHEPHAALYGYFRSEGAKAMLRNYNNKLILVFDWGGGTLDLTLCRPVGEMLVQIANDGTDAVGGDKFDEILMNALIKKVMTERKLDEKTEIFPGGKARLIDKCEAAKIQLSSRKQAVIYVESFFNDANDDSFDYVLSKEEMEQLVKPRIDEGIKRIERMLEGAGFQSEQVTLCLATGGMANMPMVKSRLHEWFGPERVRIPDGTATLIAEGAAWIAADNAGLTLAKNVELRMSRNSYLPLVKAGTSMPTEGEVKSFPVHLYCTDPRDGIAKFQLCSPKRAGKTILPKAPRSLLDNLTLNVDKQAKPFTERLELDISVNDDLILKASARSLNKKDIADCEIHNLEFGLKFSSTGGPPDPDDEFPLTESASEEGQVTGALSTRANIHVRQDLSLVPGELLYTYNKGYFDTEMPSYTSGRLGPPQEQVDEMMYYRHCSICHRDANDPACNCGSTL